jgi:hypothetical protein
MKKRGNFIVLVMAVFFVLMIACSCEFQLEGEKSSKSDVLSSADSLYENIDEVFDPEMLFCGVVSEWSKKSHKIVEYYKIDRKSHIKANDLDESTVFLKLKIGDMLEENFKFAKDKMVRISQEDIEQGDLVYFHRKSEDLSKEGNIDAVILVEQDEKSISNIKNYDDEIEENLGLYMSEEFIVTRENGRFLFFDYDRWLNYKGEKKDFSDLYNTDGRTSFRYILSPDDLKGIGLIYFTDLDSIEYATKYIVKAKIKDVGSSKNNFYVTYELENKSELVEEIIKTHSDMSEESNEYLESWNEGDIVFLKINCLDQLVSIEKLDDEGENKVNHLERGLVIDVEELDKYGDLVEMTLKDEDGKLRTFWSNDKGYFYQELKHSVISIDSVAGGYVTKVNPIISREKNSAYYTVLNSSDGQLELGYGNMSSMAPNQFDENQRSWVYLADDCIWFGQKENQNIIGERIYIELNDENRIRTVLANTSVRSMLFAGNSPYVESEDKKTSLIIGQVFKSGYGIGSLDIRGLYNNIDGKIIVDENTRGYEYSYDYDFIVKNPGELKKLYKNRLENLKEFDLTSERFRKGEIYLFNVGIDDFVARDMIKIVPSERSIFDGELTKMRFETSSGDIIELDDEFVIVNGIERIGINEFLEKYEHGVKNAVVLVGDSGKAECAIVTNNGISYVPFSFEKWSSIGENNYTGFGIEFDSSQMELFDLKSGDSIRFHLKEEPDIKRLFGKNEVDKDALYKIEGEIFKKDWAEELVIKGVEYLGKINESYIYRYLGRLNGKFVFGMGENTNDFDLEHSFILNEAEESKFRDALDYGNIYKNDERAYEDIYFEFFRDENKNLKAIEKVSMQMFNEKSEKFKSQIIPAEGRPLKNEYVDDLVEILDVVKQENDYKLTVKTSNGKEKEVIAVADNWYRYIVGEKLNARFGVVDGKINTLNWVNGIE